jgi:hypothetical protein
MAHLLFLVDNAHVEVHVASCNAGQGAAPSCEQFENLVNL